MTLRVRLPEDSALEGVTRIDGRFGLDPDRVSLARIRRAIAGGDAELPAARAMTLLFDSDFPNKHRDFEKVLADDAAPELLRRVAAAYLGRMQTPEAVEILVQQLDIRDELVLSSVVRSLGASGGRRALETLDALERDLPASVYDEVVVARTFIAHRIGVEGAERPTSSEIAFIDVDERCSGKLGVMAADRNDTELCLRALGRRPFGIELAENAIQVRCQRRVWLFLPNHLYSTHSALGGLASHRAILGLVASRVQATGLYSLAYVLLATPLEDGTIRVVATRTNGQMTFGGSARLDERGLHFSLRAAARPGAFAIGVDGTWANGELRVERAVAGFTAEFPRNRPERELPPAVQNARRVT